MALEATDPMAHTPGPRIGGNWEQDLEAENEIHRRERDGAGSNRRQTPSSMQKPGETVVSDCGR